MKKIELINSIKEKQEEINSLKEQLISLVLSERKYSDGDVFVNEQSTLFMIKGAGVKDDTMELYYNIFVIVKSKYSSSLEIKGIYDRVNEEELDRDFVKIGVGYVGADGREITKFGLKYN